MSALPAEVQKKVDAANALMDVVYPKKEDTSEEPTLDPKELIDSINQPPSDATPVDLGAAPEPAPAPVADPAPAPVADPAPAPVEEDWKHKYDTLAGKYNAEVPRLNDEVRGMQDQISSLHQLLSTLKQPEEAPVPAAATPLTLIKDEDVTEYGADLLDVIGRKGMEIVNPELVKLRAEVAQLKESLGGVTTHAAENARSGMYTSLAQSVPDWEQINAAPEFISWLRTVDVYAGVPKGALLNQAFEDNNAARVIAFFQGYQNEHAVIEPNDPPPAPGKTPAVDMATIAAPGKPRGGGNGRTQEGKRIWRQAEIKAFYADVRRGAYKSNLKDKVAIEADIIAASTEPGRIVA